MAVLRRIINRIRSQREEDEVQDMKIARYDLDVVEVQNSIIADLVEVNRLLNRRGNVDFLQEMTLEYALNLAARASGLPVEFFMQLSPWAAMQVKNRVTGFLYRQE